MLKMSGLSRVLRADGAVRSARATTVPLQVGILPFGKSGWFLNAKLKILTRRGA
jgi:hypothetical protein